MNKIELLEMIQKDQTEKVEFKRDLYPAKESKKDIAQEMAAFSNIEGGYIIFGVGDNGDIVGIEKTEGFEEKIMNIASDSVYPPIQPRYEIFEIEGKYIVLIEILKGVNKPYYPYYIRRGNTKKPVTREELRRLFQEGGLVDFDVSPVYGARIEDLDLEKIDNYFKTTLGKTIEDFEIDKIQVLINKEIIVTRNGERFVTLAGMLLFGKNPQRFLPQSTLKAVRFKGKEVGTDFIDRKEISGTLSEVIEESIRFVKRHTNLAAKIEGVRRTDMPEYLEPVVREAIINAIAHRDYSIRNANISIFIFDDRLEVRSPGKLPNAVSLDMLPLGAHYPRNRLLFLFLGAMGYGERVGTGIPRMIRLCRENGYKEPKIEEVGESFWVTLYGKESRKELIKEE